MLPAKFKFGSCCLPNPYLSKQNPDAVWTIFLKACFETGLSLKATRIKRRVKAESRNPTTQTTNNPVPNGANIQQLCSTLSASECFHYLSRRAQAHLKFRLTLRYTVCRLRRPFGYQSLWQTS